MERDEGWVDSRQNQELFNFLVVQYLLPRVFHGMHTGSCIALKLPQNKPRETTTYWLGLGNKLAWSLETVSDGYSYSLISSSRLACAVTHLAWPHSLCRQCGSTPPCLLYTCAARWGITGSMPRTVEKGTGTKRNKKGIQAINIYSCLYSWWGVKP